MLLFSIGSLLIATAALDAIWTTLSLPNAGPVTGRLSGRLWLAVRWAHARRPRTGC